MSSPLADGAFLVLALLAESETHGYDIQRLVHDRGFRFWTRLQRSSIYNALAQLEEKELITAEVTSGGGPDRKVYRITRKGTSCLRAEGGRHLAEPAHPRSELDLGIYALPFLEKAEAKAAFARCLEGLQARRAFLAERLAWCRERKLRLPALAFERPLMALDAELEWLARAAREYAAHGASADEWAQYEYREPPAADVEASEGRR